MTSLVHLFLSLVAVALCLPTATQAFVIQPHRSGVVRVSSSSSTLLHMSSADSPSSTSSTSSSVTTTPFDAYEMGKTNQVAYKDLVMGTGDQIVEEKDIVKVFYSGKVMQTNQSFGEGIFKFQYGENRVMPGWNDAVVGMRVGGSRVVKIPPSRAYGAVGQATIPPNADLEITVDMQEISKGPLAAFAMEFGLGNNRKTYALIGITLFLAISPMLNLP